jgi:hypothetical protein
MAFLFQDQNQGIQNDQPHKEVRLPRPFSFIRTLTVGFGITPNLLTLLPKGVLEGVLEGTLAGRRRSRAWACPPLPPVGIFTPP